MIEPGELEEGMVVAGKYRIDQVLGRGGMGVVVAADHVQLHQRVALKVLLPEATLYPDLIERFVREARASAQLRNEHVCRVSDVGELEDGAPYMVMELLDGQDLATLLASFGRLPIANVIEYVLQACVGLAEAHALGFIHRDLKPANLFLTRRPDGSSLVKVLDFGIAKSMLDRAGITQTHVLLGSPSYMSPEQLQSSHDVDVRSDIWALGVILYQLASGTLPFAGASIAGIAAQILFEDPPPLGGVPDRVAAVIARCLEKDPARRFPHLGSLAAALAACGRPHDVVHATAVARMLGLGDTAPMPAAPEPRPLPRALPPAPAPAPPASSSRLGPWTRRAIAFAITLATGAIAIASLL